jgi:hypothetical protein
MGEDVYAAGTPEAEIDKADGTPVAQSGKRGFMANITLTNDRMLFVDQKFGSSGNLVGDVIGAALQGRSEEKAGGPLVLLTFTDILRARPDKRRMLPDLYEFTLADGSTCRIHRKQGKKWNPIIRRLLTERHGRTVVDDGDNAWSVAATA